MAGEGNAGELMNGVEALRAELEVLRFPERTWALMREIVDAQSVRSPFSGPRGTELLDLGLTSPVDHVLVALSLTRGDDEDAVDGALRRHEFQRKCVYLARKSGHAISGVVGDHGVVVLSGSSGSLSHRRRQVAELAERIATLGRRLRLALHFGACPTSDSGPVGPSYQAALGAAEVALAQGKQLIFAKAGDERTRSLAALRRELGTTIRERPAQLESRFDRYLESVAAECGYRLEPARAYLEVGFERVAEALVQNGALDERSFRVISERLEGAAKASRRLSDLLALYRHAAADLSQAMQKPADARHDRNLRRAVDYIHRHYAEPLNRDRVAKVAGFAAGYFSKLFKEREHATFEVYVLRLRIERAKQLLDGTDLEATRIAELAGFQSPEYFSRAFRKAVGTTPIEYRKSLRRFQPSAGTPPRILTKGRAGKATP
jgi:AraC-like DNA-binding protein